MRLAKKFSFWELFQKSNFAMVLGGFSGMKKNLKTTKKIFSLWGYWVVKGKNPQKDLAPKFFLPPRGAIFFRKKKFQKKT